MKTPEKLPQVDERLRSRFQIEAPKVNAWLRERGFNEDIVNFYNNPALFPDCIPQLLELLEQSWALDTRECIATAIKHRKPDAAQKHRAYGVFLTVVRQHIGQYNVLLSTIVLNHMAWFVTPDRVHEIGEMTLDARYGELRSEMTFLLYKIGNADAIAYLLRAAKDSVTASLALDGLARLRVKEALPLCEEALANPNVLYKSAIKTTYSKLKRLAQKKPAGPSHETNEAPPEDLAEWSANLDAEDLPKFLRGIQKCVEAGFGKAEILEATSAADNLSHDQTTRLKFPIRHREENIELWLEIFCDDENAFDLYAMSTPEFISRIELQMEKILQ